MKGCFSGPVTYLECGMVLLRLHYNILCWLLYDLMGVVMMLLFFSSRNIPWRNMVGYASDNTNSMVGERNSVLSRLREKQPKLIDLGCICHLENLCVVDACKKLLLPIDELLIDVFYHFHNRYL